MPHLDKGPCTCGALEGASKEPGYPIRWDETTNEYSILCGKTGRMVVYYCPFCGGSVPKSHCASSFAQVTEQEERRIEGLFAGLRTVADVTERFGPPDEEWNVASAVRHPGAASESEPGGAFRGLVYNHLSPVADIVFKVGKGDSVQGTWIQKYIGEGAPPSYGGSAPQRV